MSNIIHKHNEQCSDNDTLRECEVHCPTKAEANELLQHWHELGYVWPTGQPLIDKIHWSVNGEGTVYTVSDGLVRYCAPSCNTRGQRILFQEFKANGFKFPENDGVNTPQNPSHYKQGIEPFEVLERLKCEWDNTLEPACFSNVLKYTLRANFKGDKLNDLKKAAVYLDKWIEHVNSTSDSDKVMFNGCESFD